MSLNPAQVHVREEGILVTTGGTDMVSQRFQDPGEAARYLAVDIWRDRSFWPSRSKFDPPFDWDAFNALVRDEMDAIGAEALCEAHAVVDDEGDAGIRADTLQRLRQTRELMLGDVLHPQLKRRDDIVLDGGSQPVGEGATRVLGRDQVQPAGLLPLGRREVGRLELVFQG